MTEETKHEEEKVNEEIKDPQKVLEFARKAIEEKKRVAEKNRDLEAQLEAIKTKSLEEQQNYKVLADEYKKKWEAEKETVTKFQTSLIEGKKKQSLIAQLEKMGIRSDRKEALLQLAKYDAIKFDDEHKIAFGHEEEASRLKTMLPECFGKPSTNMNSSSPDIGNEGEVTLESYKKMSLEDKRKAYPKLRGFAPEK